jgi:hypothetical protein
VYARVPSIRAASDNGNAVDSFTKPDGCEHALLASAIGISMATVYPNSEPLDEEIVRPRGVIRKR